MLNLELRRLEKDLEIEKEDDANMLQKLIKQDLEFEGTADEYYKTFSKRQKEAIKEERSKEVIIDEEDRKVEYEEIKIQEAKQREIENKRQEELKKQEERKRRPKSRFTVLQEAEPAPVISQPQKISHIGK